MSENSEVVEAIVEDIKMLGENKLDSGKQRGALYEQLLDKSGHGAELKQAQSEFQNAEANLARERAKLLQAVPEAKKPPTTEAKESETANLGLSGLFEARKSRGESHLTIGRRSETDGIPDIEVKGINISRKHAEIGVVETQDGRHYFLRDVGSTNGTFLNGKQLVYLPLQGADRLQPNPLGQRLNSGDVIQVGLMDFKFRVDENGKPFLDENIPQTLILKSPAVVAGEPRPKG